ncbi:hypothetical protein J6590_048566 [Homalodisca vitripennis]|nr:hypothetical protein J6590_048566 [Homalodisca vitripennis]
MRVPSYPGSKRTATGSSKKKIEKLPSTPALAYHLLPGLKGKPGCKRVGTEINVESPRKQNRTSRYRDLLQQVQMSYVLYYNENGHHKQRLQLISSPIDFSPFQSFNTCSRFFRDSGL